MDIMPRITWARFTQPQDFAVVCFRAVLDTLLAWAKAADWATAVDWVMAVAATAVMTAASASVGGCSTTVMADVDTVLAWTVTVAMGTG
jgi:hypothetical protein